MPQFKREMVAFLTGCLIGAITLALLSSYISWILMRPHA